MQIDISFLRKRYLDKIGIPKPFYNSEWLKNHIEKIEKMCVHLIDTTDWGGLLIEYDCGEKAEYVRKYCLLAQGPQKTLFYPTNDGIVSSENPLPSTYREPSRLVSIWWATDKEQKHIKESEL